MTITHRKSGIAYTAIARIASGVLILRPTDPVLHPLGRWPQLTTHAFKWPENRAAFDREFVTT